MKIYIRIITPQQKFIGIEPINFLVISLRKIPLTKALGYRDHKLFFPLKSPLMSNSIEFLPFQLRYPRTSTHHCFLPIHCIKNHFLK